MMKVLTKLIIAISISSAGLAHAGEIEIKDAWARATIPSAKTAAVYMVIVNNGSADGKLTGAKTPIAKKAQIHSTEVKDGMMMMSKLDHLVAPAGGQVELAPGGKHLMLIGLEHGLKAGEMIHLMLSFESRDDVMVMVPVKESGEEGMYHGEHTHEHHDME